MFTVAKFNKRLYVMDGDERLYTPPDFLRQRLTGRREMHALADSLNEGVPYIKAVIAFETALRPSSSQATR
jgi:hypothetical protein